MDEKEAVRVGSEVVSQHGGMLAWCGAAVTVVGGWFTNRAKVQELDTRLKHVEERFVDGDGNERYVKVVSYRQARGECREEMQRDIASIAQSQDQLRQDVRSDVNGLHGKLDDILKIMAERSR